MFDINVWQEIFSTIRKNKLRTFLTGFSVAWGIFMLILLLGAGNGLKNGMMSNFGSSNVNSMQIWSGRTSIPYAGYNKDRWIDFDYRDLDLVENKLPNVGVVSPELYLYAKVAYGKNEVSYGFRGVMPAFAEINGYKIIPGYGRYINEIDMKGKRKVVVIGKSIMEELFGDRNPVGENVRIDNVIFQVVGVYETSNTWKNNQANIPYTTARLIYSKNEDFSISFTLDGLNTEAQNLAYDTLVRKSFASLHNYDPKDESAIWTWNRLSGYLQTMGIFNGITLFIWIIGLGTLIGGVVGVGNIMLITVKERTKEFGIRKSIGATPNSIVKLIMLESVVITSIFGYIGMFLGVVLTEAIGNMIGAGGGDRTMFVNPTVDLNIAIMANVVMIIAGVIAGYIPARKAAKISPIEALRYE